jgi:ABC-2 type transport system permease protein
VAYRDLLKFVRDRPRVVTSMLFPFVFVALFGGTMQAGYSAGGTVGFDFLAFTFSGVLAMTLFQSSAMGIVSLIDDRESDFSQEIFVAPISRHVIVLGKICGESMVALVQGAGIVLLSLVLGVELSLSQLPAVAVASVLVCLMGGAFGLILMTNLRTRRAAEQVFPLVFLPQYFLAGVFAPVAGLPPLLNLASHLAPMRYAVDFVRGAFYATSPTYASDAAVVQPDALVPAGVVVLGLFLVFMALGTRMFVRSERNR